LPRELRIELASQPEGIVAARVRPRLDATPDSNGQRCREREHVDHNEGVTQLPEDACSDGTPLQRDLHALSP